MQQSSSLHSGQLSKYGAGPLNENLNSLKHITVATHRERFNDPLGVAERGKVGVPSSSECSSNSSADASVESNMGILHGERKGNFEFDWKFFCQTHMYSDAHSFIIVLLADFSAFVFLG